MLKEISSLTLRSPVYNNQMIYNNEEPKKC